MKRNKEALICDLAEYYQIYDYKEFPPSYIAILAIGLSNDSRIKRHYSGSEVAEDYLLQSLIFDRLNLILWMLGGGDEPISLYDLLVGNTSSNKQTTGFDSGEEYEAKRNQLLQTIKRGGQR